MNENIPITLPKFLWYFAKRYKLCLIGFVVVVLIWAVYLSLSPFLMKLLIDGITNWNNQGSLFSAIFYPAILYVGLGFTVGLNFRFYDWLTLKTYPKMKIEIMEEMFEHVEKHSYHYFQHNFAGSLGNKINDMARCAITVISSLIEHFIGRAFSLIIGSITMFLVHPYFAILLIAWSSIFITVSLLLSKKAQKYAEIFSEARSLSVGKIIDSIGNILNVKLFAREAYEKKYLEHFLDDSAKKDRLCMWYLLKVKVFYTFSITCLNGSMMYFLIQERSKNNVTNGDFVLILTLSMFLTETIFFVANQLVPFAEAVGTCKQALSLITQKHDIIDAPDSMPLAITKGDILFDKVYFKYKRGRNVFSDKSVSIHSGQKIGLVGFSGSGKSTFVNLILRFYDVDKGKILIDGQDIKTVTQESLHRHIAMIPQDPALFHRSLEENIRYGRLDATLDEVILASKNAHCHEFIEKLPEGYQSLVGERGVKLSGGQRQRIAIARALLKNAPILILDEATSSLDSVTESYIQESLNVLMQGRTTIVIAHRLSTLFRMDRLLVFSEGKIIEDGAHEELIKQNGHYAKLWNMQAGGFLRDPPIREI